MTDQLKSIAERIGHLMDERDGLGADIRDIYSEAKSSGYVPKVLRKAIARLRMDAGKRDEEDAILQLYEDALGAVGRAVAAVLAGSTWKEAGEEHGVPRASLARAVKVSNRRSDTKISDAAPEGCEDGVSVSPVAETVVPPWSTPQADEPGSLSVMPVPDEGVGDWQPNEIGAVAEPSAAPRVAAPDSNPIPLFLRRGRG